MSQRLGNIEGFDRENPGRIILHLDEMDIFLIEEEPDESSALGEVITTDME